MTLPELKKNVRQAHIPEVETHTVDFIFDIKKWIEPCLNTIKNHVYPHAYKFMKINGQVVMKYKQWANDEKWQPERSGLHILAKQPEGISPLVRLNSGLGGLISSHTKDVIGLNGVLPPKTTFLMREKANGIWKN